MVEEKIGMIIHFFTNVNVAAIKITAGELKVGDTIHIVGAHTDFKQRIDSMEIDRNPVQMVVATADLSQDGSSVLQSFVLVILVSVFHTSMVFFKIDNRDSQSTLNIQLMDIVFQWCK